MITFRNFSRESLPVTEEALTTARWMLEAQVVNFSINFEGPSASRPPIGYEALKIKYSRLGDRRKLDTFLDSLKSELVGRGKGEDMPSQEQIQAQLKVKFPELPTYKEFLENYIKAAPADREQAESLIKAYHKAKGLNSNPTFVWCGSPQSALVMAALVSNMHEDGPLRVETHSNIKGGGRDKNSPHNRPYNNPTPVPNMRQGLNHQVAQAERARAPGVQNRTMRVRVPHPYPDAQFRLRPLEEERVYQDNLQGFHYGPRERRRRGRVQDELGLWPGEGGGEGLWSFISSRMDNNPKTDFFAIGKSSNLLQAALDSSTPLENIPLRREYYGRRLHLKSAYRGQFINDDCAPYIAWILSKFCGPVWDYDDYVFCSERPTILKVQNSNIDSTEEYRLHSSEGPAIEYPDGWKLHIFNGVVVPSYVIDNTKMISRLRINNEWNVEIRRIMIDRYKLGQPISGAAAYVKDSKADIIDHSERFGTLYRLASSNSQDEPISLLEVVNRTPEADGSFKHYHLRVPPSVTTAREAVAWSFGLSADEYDPLQES